MSQKWDGQYFSNEQKNNTDNSKISFRWAE